ncbi:uncharacterized protein LOC143035159 [Oratosquilla oratoria]|uniref:uncharacterized protein LOC143035159 n=1 Tax=Oratosquilla oratoria TaxID=337810 RepID=UPI003F75F19C
MARHKRTKMGRFMVTDVLSMMSFNVGVTMVGFAVTWVVLVTGFGHCCRAGPTGYVSREGDLPGPVGGGVEEPPPTGGEPWRAPWATKVNVGQGEEGVPSPEKDATELKTPQAEGSEDALEDESLSSYLQEDDSQAPDNWVFLDSSSSSATWPPEDVPLFLTIQQPKGDNLLQEDACMFLGRGQRVLPPKIEGPDALEVFLREFRSQLLQKDNTSLSVAGSSRSGGGSTSQHLAPLPEGCEYLDRMAPQRIMCRGANITDVPSFAYSVRNAAVLTFDHTGIQRLGPQDTEDLPRVSSLSFTHGKLFSLLPYTFTSSYKLQELSLAHNAIREWFLGIFVEDPSSNIRILNLQDNRISFPPEPVHVSSPVLPHLETLILSENPLCVLPGDLFRPLKNSPVTSLFLKSCRLNSFSNSSINGTDKSPLAYLPKLRRLDLSINSGLNSEELTRLLSPLRELTDLYLGNNNYHSVPFGVLERVGGSLKTLDLHGSVFTCLDNSSFPAMAQLTHLNLMYCRIKVVQEHTFDNLISLTHINLDGNILTTIPSAIILPTLQELTLNQNPRGTGDGSPNMFELDATRYSQDLGHLNNLSLSQVPLREISVTCFKGMRHVTHLHLEKCEVEVIYPKSFVDMSSLMYLWLRGNYLRVLDNNTFVGLEHLLFLDLSENRIGCYSFTVPVGPPVPVMKDLDEDDIFHSLRQPLEALSKVHRAYREQNLQRKDPVDTVLEKGVPQNLVRWFLPMKTRTKPGPQGEARHSVGRYNHTPFVHLRRLKTLDLSGNRISILDDVIFSDLIELVRLNLSNNDIEGWDEHVFSKIKNLSEIVLRFNRIRQLSSCMMDDLGLTYTLLDLRDNILACSCELRQMAQLWNKSDFVKWDGVCYMEKPFLPTPMQDYLNEDDCPMKESPDFSTIIASSVVVALVIVTAVATYKKRWYIRYLAYSARLRIKKYREDVTSNRHAFDAFVSYAKDDRQWVFENLLTKLEEGGRYRVCVHERDFTAGQVITENIIEAIEKSRKVILVISRAFVASPWCMFELQIAAHKILDERRNKAVLVLLESVPHDELPKHLRVLMKMRTYIAWVPNDQGQRLFWARLLRAVSKPSDSEDVMTSSTGVPEEDPPPSPPPKSSSNNLNSSTQVIPSSSLPSSPSTESFNQETDLKCKYSSGNTLSCPSVHPPSLSASRTSLPPYKYKYVDSGFCSNATSWSELSAGQLSSMSSSALSFSGTTSTLPSSRTTSSSSSSIPAIYYIPPSSSSSSSSFNSALINKQPVSSQISFPSSPLSSFPSSFTTSSPSSLPSSSPSCLPSTFNTSSPSSFPSSLPSSSPSSLPSPFPSSSPSLLPSSFPASFPSSFPSSFTSNLRPTYLPFSSSVSSSVPSSPSLILSLPSPSVYSTASISKTKTVPSGVSTITSNTEADVQRRVRDFRRVGEEVASL